MFGRPFFARCFSSSRSAFEHVQRQIGDAVLRGEDDLVDLRLALGDREAREERGPSGDRAGAAQQVAASDRGVFHQALSPEDFRRL